MKKVTGILLLLIMVVFTYGCGTVAGYKGDEEEKPGEPTITNEPTIQQEEIHTFQAEVIVTGSSLLVTPDVNSNEYKSSDKISVNIMEAVLTNSEKEVITADLLQPGDYVNITYNGMIAESYPAQIQASAVEITGHNIIIEGYLAMIDQIWQEDKGLNDSIQMIALDTTGWIELRDIEKEILFERLKGIYSYEIVEATFEELKEQGLIENNYGIFSKGVLIVINEMSYDKENRKFTYSIYKWRAGDGAVGADGSKASFNGTDWEIKEGGFWIS